MPKNDRPPPTEGVRVEFGERIISEFQRRRQRPDGLNWVAGYTQGELDAAQAKYDLVFPPDLIALLRERRPVIGYDWRSDEEEIREKLAWPLEGLLFDVENNVLWWPEWGERPALAEDRAAVLRSVVAQAPKLIPLISHRYLPAEPHEAGNPVFSVYQSDVIYYGANLTDYFERELVDLHRPFQEHIKRIRFWSDLVERTDRLPMTPATIFMPLLNEGTEVWAPVSAEPVGDAFYCVLGPMPEDQEWQFAPGSIVRVANHSFSTGEVRLAVIGLAFA